MKPLTILHLPRLLAAFLACLAAPAIALFGMSNQDIVAMVEAGLGEDTIVLAIESDGEPDYDTSASALIELANAGVSERVIKAMLAKGAEPETPAERTAPTAETASGFPFKEASSDDVMPPVISPEVGKTYYTRINFWHERGRSNATNYSRGDLIPINTKATLTRIRRNAFDIELENGETVRIDNVPNYTGYDTSDLPSRYLAESETNLSLYGEEAAQQIRSGNLRLGMNKDQVVLTRGYPPVHETPSLESDTWTYWSSRFVQRRLVFEGDILKEGRGLR